MSDARDQAARVLQDTDDKRGRDPAREVPAVPELPGDRSMKVRRTSLSRMRRTWIPDDAIVIGQIQADIDQIIKDRFRVAFAVMRQIHLHVREQKIDKPSGELLYYVSGDPIWEESAPGVPAEDFTRLSDATRENLLYAIVTHMYEWELAKGALWTEAMLGKVAWEERFSSAFIAMSGSQISGKPTVDDRTQHGNHDSIAERYFSVYLSALSKQADGLVSAMKGLQYLLEKTAIR